MRTRMRLNLGFFNGSLLLAAVVGSLLQSWTIFVIALVILLVGNVVANEIRLGGTSKQNRR